MKTKIIYYRILLLVLFLPGMLPAGGQNIEKLGLNLSGGLELASLGIKGSKDILLPQKLPLFSLKIDGELYHSTETVAREDGGLVRYTFNGTSVTGAFEAFSSNNGWSGRLSIKNYSVDTVIISSLVPLGAYGDHLYISGNESYLHRPGKEAVSVLLPKGTHDLGYSSVEIDMSYSLCALARLSSLNGAREERDHTFKLPPNSGLDYIIYARIFSGDWQNGLRKVFGEAMLKEADSFENRFYERADMNWVRDKYLLVAQPAWDREFYDREKGRYRFHYFLENAKTDLGGIGVFALILPSSGPGLDERELMDIYNDIPFGLPKINELGEYGRRSGTRFLLSWDPGHSSLDNIEEQRLLTSLLIESGVDGLILTGDTERGKELVDEVDNVKPGLIVYPASMPSPRSMQWYITGREEPGKTESPVLNLNRLLKPENKIFLVNSLEEDDFDRDVAIAFFNGQGTELNYCSAIRPSWMEDSYKYLGRTLRILRENSSVFSDPVWIPLLDTRVDNIYVNEWKSKRKRIYTILGNKAESYEGALFEVEPEDDYHYISLWHNQELEPERKDGKWYIDSDLGDRDIDCIARLPELLSCRLKEDSLFVSSSEKGEIRIWDKAPSYGKNPLSFVNAGIAIKLSDHFGEGPGRYIVQLVKNGELMDERIVEKNLGRPVLVNPVKRTRTSKRPPRAMVEVPAGSFVFISEATLQMQRFFIDKYPVTNQDFLEFMQATLYVPEDPRNFLKHWREGTFPSGQGKYPVVYISQEDARAFAKWKGKRLPTEAEWQYAAQGTDGRKWPWGNEFHGTKCNNGFGRPTPVDAFSKGESPFKVMDLVGNVWQLTSDVYDNGSYRYVKIRGGSYYDASNDREDAPGGPRPVDETNMLILMNQGMERSATIGFRCVRDAD